MHEMTDIEHRVATARFEKRCAEINKEFDEYMALVKQQTGRSPYQLMVARTEAINQAALDCWPKPIVTLETSVRLALGSLDGGKA